MGGHLSIADHAVIGGAAAIHRFVRIGRAAMIGGVSGVEADRHYPFGSHRQPVAAGGAQCDRLKSGAASTRRRCNCCRVRVCSRLFRRDGVFARQLAAVRAFRYGGEALIDEVLAFIDAPSHRGLIRAE